MRERIYTRFTDETQLLQTGFVDHVYIKEAGKKEGIIIYLERQFMSLRRILLFCCTVTCIVCIISAAYRNTVIGSTIIGSVSSCHLDSAVLPLVPQHCV